MKRIILSLIALLFIFVGYSQDTTIDKSYKKEDFNLFSSRKKPVKVSIYASIDFSYQQLRDEHFEDNQSWAVGARIGAVLNKHIVIGVHGFTNSENLYNNHLNLYMRYGGGGFFIEPRIFPKIPIHISLPVKAGLGTIYYLENNWKYYNTSYDPTDITRDTYFYVEPGGEVEINIVRYFKISGGVTYRFTDPIRLLETPSDVINGWTFYGSLKIIYP